MKHRKSIRYNLRTNIDFYCESKVLLCIHTIRLIDRQIDKEREKDLHINITRVMRHNKEEYWNVYMTKELLCPQVKGE
jgi:hypothetical protein